MSGKLEIPTLAQVQGMMRGSEPVPGMYDFIMKVTKRIFAAEERMVRVFCERNGIEIPPPEMPLLEKQRMLANKVLIIHQSHSAASPDFFGLNPEAEFVMQQTWCADIRTDPSNVAMSWPMVVVVRKGDTFQVNIHDPDGKPGMYDDLGGEL